MKVLNVINGLGAGGAEKLLIDLLPLLNKHEEIEVELLLLTDKNSVYKDHIIGKGIHVNVCESNKLYSIKNLAYIRSLILNGKYDIVHAHLFPTNYYISLISKTIFNKNVHFIFTEHSTHNRRRNKFIMRYIEKYIYSSFSKILSISKETEKNLIEWLRPTRKLNKFTVVENGIDLKKYYTSSRIPKTTFSKHINKNDKLICMVGRFSHQKDQSTLIRAMKLLDDDVHLLLIGEGEYKDNNIKLTQELDLSKRVHFLGFRKDVPNILQSVDINVLSSVWEGFGLAALEGMATKKPVIATDVEGLRGIIDREDLLFKVGDSVYLAEIIKRLLNDAEYYNQVCEYLFERSRNFDINKTADKIKSIYLRCH
ncbi:glycosyltransferase [Oceanobacillus caeni]|uniref:glycosyltransferase n=1 Tax=Oceanobacillus caeni TaxID=405946 RepID=UPI0036396C45